MEKLPVGSHLTVNSDSNLAVITRLYSNHYQAVLDTCHSGSLLGGTTRQIYTSSEIANVLNLDLKHYRCNRVLGPKRSDSGWKALIPAFCEQTGLRQRRGAISERSHGSSCSACLMTDT